jgi:hypothetical protein
MSNSYLARKDIPLTNEHMFVLAMLRDEEIALVVIRRTRDRQWENGGPAVIIEPTNVMDLADTDDAVLTYGRFTVERAGGMVTVRIDDKIAGKASAESFRSGVDAFLNKIA